MARVFVAAWHAGYQGVVPVDVLEGLDVGTTAEWMARLLEDGAASTVVVTLDGEVAGWTRFGPDRERPGPDKGYLASLYVHPSAAGRGLGRVLLQHALTQLHRAGRPDVRLEVFEGNARARALYERAGFRLDGTRAVDPRWRTPQVGYRRHPINAAVRLPELPDVDLDPLRMEIGRVRRPLRQPFRTALREVRELSGWQVTLTTTGGLTAIGTTVATPEVTGDDDAAIGACLHGPLREAVGRGGALSEVLRSVADSGAGTRSAAAAVDMAVHGVAAAALGRPLVELIGGRREHAPVRSGITISVDSPQGMADAAERRVAEGFGTLKLKLADPALDVARVLAVRDRLDGTPVRLRIDANQAWTPDDAVRVLDRLAAAEVDLELVEQPVPGPDLAGMAFVTTRSPYPVLADESVFTSSDVLRVADAGAAHLVNLKLLKCGGLLEASRMASACAETGLGLLVGCMLEPEPGIDAARALAAVASDGPLAHDLDAPWWITPEGAPGNP
jgi:L-alanine-DL-glutamate epimerase-like enolase superfamily enzyme/GNAT superfamily N-acetyltransferase